MGLGFLGWSGWSQQTFAYYDEIVGRLKSLDFHTKIKVDAGYPSYSSDNHNPRVNEELPPKETIDFLNDYIYNAQPNISFLRGSQSIHRTMSRGVKSYQIVLTSLDEDRGAEYTATLKFRVHDSSK